MEGVKARVAEIIASNHATCCRTDYCENSTADEVEAIVELVRGLVPEESKSTCVCDRDGCWNDCRDLMLKRLDVGE